MPDDRHIRAKIRSAVAAALKGIPETADKVFEARAWPLEVEDLPAWLVHIEGERIETRQTGRQARQARTISINAVLVCKHSDKVEDEMDELSARAEEILLSDQSVASLTRNFTLTEVASALNDDAALVVGQTALTFSAETDTVGGAPRVRG